MATATNTFVGRKVIVIIGLFIIGLVIIGLVIITVFESVNCNVTVTGARLTTQLKWNQTTPKRRQLTRFVMQIKVSSCA
jgi:hypothetical protein